MNEPLPRAEQDLEHPVDQPFLLRGLTSLRRNTSC
jgi:hypothetical protein